MFAVIRVRGTVNIDKRVNDTMKMMRLDSGNHCAILPQTPEVKGMLQKVKDYVTWGEISKEVLAKMLEKRLRGKGGEERVNEKNIKELTGFDSFESFAAAIMDGKVKMHQQEKVHAIFRLTPPSKGFKSITETYPRGDLGYRGKEINVLIERMI